MSGLIPSQTPDGVQFGLICCSCSPAGLTLVFGIMDMINCARLALHAGRSLAAALVQATLDVAGVRSDRSLRPRCRHAVADIGAARLRPRHTVLTSARRGKAPSM